MNLLRWAIVAAAVCFAHPTWAQNNAARPDAAWTEQVANYLDAQHQYPDYEQDRNFDDWVVGLERRFLGSRKASNTYRLEAGQAYLIVGACDADCSDLDLQAFDSTGTSVALDRAIDDHPVLRITPISSDDFRIDVWWAECRATPCYAGVRVLRQTNGAASGPMRRVTAHGTGFLVTDDGYIVTNHHVIDGARSVGVNLNGIDYDAEVVSFDEANDLALLKADLVGVPLSVISSLDIQRGSEVFTLGYPMVSLQGSEQKATFGRINALSGIADDRRYLQMDAAIQPGNSGGPLLDASGRVVGVVTATLNQGAVLRTSGHIAQSVNYAIKSDYLLPLLPPPARRQVEAPASMSMTEAVNRSQQSVVLVTVR